MPAATLATLLTVMQGESAVSQVRLDLSNRPVVATVDLGAVEHNVRALQQVIGTECRIMAVVKANGYGLGAPWIAGAALRAGATMLGVACVDEGVELRQAGIDAPVLVMGYVPPEEALKAVANHLSVSLHSPETATALEQAAVEIGLLNRSANVHIKIDTGLGRYGCLPEDFISLIESVALMKHLHLQGLMTHFAEADSRDLSYSRQQLGIFEDIRRQAAERGIEFEIVHAANTAAALSLPESRFDMVRSGILLSGHLPATHLSQVVRLEPVFTLKSRLARVFHAEEGQSVGYGRTWRADRSATIGLVPLGYADGYVRALSNRAQVLVGGCRCPVVGRVSMDQLTIDLSGVEKAVEGDEVVLVGRQGEEEISVDDLANWAGTISYEILCGLTHRVPRRYVRSDITIGAGDLLGDIRLGAQAGDQV